MCIRILWSMSPRASAKKIEANHLNAKKSTGAKTTAGKLIVRTNALKHGLLAKYAVVISSDGPQARARFEELLTAIRDELDPVGMLENVLVERIATSIWKLRRVAAHEREELSLMRTRDKAEAVEKQLESDRKTGEAVRVLWDERARRYRSTQVGAGWGWSSLSQEYKDRVAHARETLHSTFSGIVYLGLWLHSIHSAVEEDR